jgi:DNA-binding transcriptional ArsR family regulator
MGAFKYTLAMLEAILDTKTKEKILLALFVAKEVYARDLAVVFKGNLSSIQNQFKKLERGGVVVSRLKGRTRMYSFNPRYAFKTELEKLLEKALSFMPAAEKKKYYTPRLRPRRAGKPL